MTTKLSVPKSPRIWQLSERRYQLIGTECLKCGMKFIGPRKICPNCGSRELRDVKLSKTGKIYSYTVIRIPPTERVYDKPYVMAIVELDDGCKLTAEIVDCRPEEVKIGMPVEAVFRKIGEENEAGVIYYGYKFRPKLK